MGCIIIDCACDECRRPAVRERFNLGHGIADLILDLDEPTHERLAAYAKRHGVSVDGAAEEVINRILDEEERQS